MYSVILSTYLTTCCTYELIVPMYVQACILICATQHYSQQNDNVSGIRPLSPSDPDTNWDDVVVIVGGWFVRGHHIKFIPQLFNIYCYHQCI